MLELGADQVSGVCVQPVGGVLEAGDLGGVERQKDTVFVPVIFGWRGAIIVVAGQDGLLARRHRRGNSAQGWRWRHCGTKVQLSAATHTEVCRSET